MSGGAHPFSIVGFRHTEGMGPVALTKLKGAVEVLCDGSSGDAALERAVLGVMVECFELWKERHSKYGRGNISGFGAIGCLVRGSDKMARLKHAMLEGKGVDAADESLDDSWKDLLNYAAMGLLCKRGEWPT